MSTSEAVDLFVPGRLCLFGEHSDWAGGYRSTHPDLSPGLCITVGTEQGIHATARRHPNGVRMASRIRGMDVETLSLPADVAALDRVARRGGWWSFAAGTAAEVLADHPVGGIELDVLTMTLPLRKGLSSSAAICVLVARAFSTLYGLRFDPPMEMELAYRGERRTRSRCGRMDQVCAYGSVPSVLRFDGDDLEVEPFRPGGDLHLLIADLGGDKDTIRILHDLNALFPDAPGAIAANVRRGLGPENRRLGRAAISALRRGDGCEIGALMTEAQALFDRLVAPGCTHELEAPLLHRALGHPPLADLVWGGKGVGSQGDGTVQFLARGIPERDEARRVLARDLGLEAIDLDLRAS